MAPRSFQVIVTRYHGCGNVRGSRVKATAAAGSVTLQWDDGLQADENHIEAAKALAKKYDWAAEWHMGSLPDGARVFVQVDIGAGPIFVSYRDERKKVA